MFSHFLSAHAECCIANWYLCWFHICSVVFVHKLLNSNSDIDCWHWCRLSFIQSNVFTNSLRATLIMEKKTEDSSFFSAFYYRSLNRDNILIMMKLCIHCSQSQCYSIFATLPLCSYLSVLTKVFSPIKYNRDSDRKLPSIPAI